MDERTKRIQEAIQKKGLSYSELERLTGVSHSALQRYASGKTKKIPIDVIEKIADVTGVTARYLMCWDEESKTNEKTPLEPLALKASKSEWIYILERMSEENLIKLMDYALLLLMSQDQDGQGDQGSAK